MLEVDLIVASWHIALARGFGQAEMGVLLRCLSDASRIPEDSGSWE